MPKSSKRACPPIEIGVRRGAPSFTLPEMLVACAIFAFMMLVLMGLVSQSSRVWQQGSGDRIKRESARILLDMIGRDLESAVFPPVPSLNAPLDFQLNPSVSGGSYLNPTAAFWQTAIPGSGKSTGDVQDVGYFVNWVTSGNLARGTLCRLVIPPTAAESVFSNPMLPTRTWSQTVLNLYAPGLSIVSSGASNAYKGLLAENVLGLWITLYDTNQAVIGSAALPYDSRSTSRRPTYADISIAVIDPTAAQRITSASTITNAYSGAGATNANAFVTALPAMYQQAARVFSTRVQIQAGQ